MQIIKVTHGTTLVPPYHKLPLSDPAESHCQIQVPKASTVKMARAAERLAQVHNALSVPATVEKPWKPRDRPYNPSPPVKASQFGLIWPYFRTDPSSQLIIVGAGVAGVAASILISKKVRNLSYTVYERQDDVVSIYLLAMTSSPPSINKLSGRHVGTESLSWHPMRHSFA